MPGVKAHAGGKGSCPGRYHTDRQRSVDELVYVLAMAVAVSVGATVQR
jgi:hypothetical protein